VGLVSLPACLSFAPNAGFPAGQRPALRQASSARTKAPVGLRMGLFDGLAQVRDLLICGK
jgi:hypothetical protein